MKLISSSSKEIERTSEAYKIWRTFLLRKLRRTAIKARDPNLEAIVNLEIRVLK